MQNLETRTIRNSSMESDGNTLRGYIALFNTESVPMGFIEVIAPGCFKSSLDNPDEDIVALINHDDDAPLGRRSKGTLKLTEDATGLAFSLDLPETTRANDLKVNIQRGDVQGCSFGFVCKEDSWEQRADGAIVRTLIDVDLFEVSVGVTFPAYSDTSATLRSALKTAPQEIRSRLEGSQEVVPIVEEVVIADESESIRHHMDMSLTITRLK